MKDILRAHSSRGSVGACSSRSSKFGKETTVIVIVEYKKPIDTRIVLHSNTFWLHILSKYLQCSFSSFRVYLLYKQELWNFVGVYVNI